MLRHVAALDSLCRCEDMNASAEVEREVQEQQDRLSKGGCASSQGHSSYSQGGWGERGGLMNGIMWCWGEVVVYEMNLGLMSLK